MPSFKRFGHLFTVIKCGTCILPGRKISTNHRKPNNFLATFGISKKQNNDPIFFLPKKQFQSRSKTFRREFVEKIRSALPIPSFATLGDTCWRRCSTDLDWFGFFFFVSNDFNSVFVTITIRLITLDLPLTIGIINHGEPSTRPFSISRRHRCRKPTGAQTNVPYTKSAPSFCTVN